MFAIIHAAGWPIYFLLAVSVIAVALIIERFMILRKEKIVPGGLLERVLHKPACMERLLTAFCGAWVLHGLRHGTTPVSSVDMIRSVTTS